MASSEEVVPVLPDTLPDNFNEWDSEASSAPVPGGADEWESVSGRSESPRQKAHGEPENLDAILSSVADRSRVWRSDTHAPVPAPFIDKPLNEYVNLEKDRPNSSQTFFANSHRSTAQRTPDKSTPEKSSPEKSSKDTPSSASSQPEALHTLDMDSDAPDLPNAALANEAHTSSVTYSMTREADKALFEAFSAKNSENHEEPGAGKNKRLMIVGGVAAAILVPLIPMLLLGHHGTKSSVNPSVQPVSAAIDSQPDSSTPDQSGTEPSAQVKPSAAAKSQQAVERPFAQAGTDAGPQPAVAESQIQMMKGQLSAPGMISEAVKKQTAENAPPPQNIGTAGMDALSGNGLAANAFTGSAKPIVRPLKPVAISSGVATGMLIKKTPPIYPEIAKTARVAGTVELAATISKTGTIKDLHVVSGPAMLRQAAVDAVRTWRYKPYELNNEPVEVETSINVVFNLGN
jgi:TonB family protein